MDQVQRRDDLGGVRHAPHVVQLDVRVRRGQGGGDCPGFAPLYATLERLYGVQMGRALSTIEVVQLRDDEAALLQLPPGASALQVQGTTFDQDDRATEVSRVLYRADRFTFSLESHRVGGRLKNVIGPAADRPPSP